MSSETLLHAVLAVSANDLRNRNDAVNSSWYERRLLHHKFASIRALRKLFDSGSTQAFSGNLDGRDSILLTVLMHCYLEIASGSRHEWVAHLKGAISVIEYHCSRSHSTSEPLFSPSILQFVNDYFSLRHTLSATALDQDSYFQNGQWNQQWQIPLPFPSRSDDWSNLTCINVDIGLSSELLDIISSITSFARLKYSLRREGRSGYLEESKFRDTVLTLQQRLQTLRQWSPEQDRTHLLYYNAAAFKEATYIYLRHAGFDDPISHSSIQEHHLPKLLALFQRIHTKQGDNLGSIPYPLWALFVASCVAAESERGVCMSYWTDLKKCRPVSNVPITMKAVEAVWKMRDLNPKKGSDDHPRLALEWEEALGRLGWKMALS